MICFRIIHSDKSFRFTLTPSLRTPFFFHLFLSVSFLNELERVTSIRYSPSDDDIIRARLRTVGVQEHNIVLESGPEPGREWIIYDVGGTRSLVRFFSRIILYLLPIC